MKKLVVTTLIAFSLAFTGCFKDDDTPIIIEEVTIINNNGGGDDGDTCPVEAVTGVITENMTWTNDRIYQLNQKVVVDNGATRTIEAATIIKGSPGTGSLASALIVARGSKLNAVGTASAPIIFTSTSDTGTYLINIDTFNPIDACEGEQHIGANYVSLEFQISEKLKSVVGLRTEFFKTYYTGTRDNNTIFFDRDLILDEFDFFPSANMIYSVSDNTNLRASYSRTTARPSFKEASVSQIFDPITNRLFIGNIDIVPTYINNFDLRYEHFGDSGQMFAVSGFYKGFTDAIEQQFFINAPSQLTVGNLGDASVFGAELEVRQRLGFIMESLNDLKFNANVSIIKSQLTMSQDEFDGRQASARNGETIDRERQLQGQAPFLINVGLDYNNDNLGLQTGLFYNVQGKTLEVVGIREVPDVYTKPFNSLNFTLNKSFGEDKSSSIDLKISNILGSERRSDYESFGAQDQIFTLRDPGTSFSLGYAYKF